MCYAAPMQYVQCAVSIAAAFAFDRWQASDPLPTMQSWLLSILIVGFGSAWLFTVITVRLADSVRYGRLGFLRQLAERVRQPRRR